MRRFHFYHAETGALHHSAIVVNVPAHLVDDCVRKNCPVDHKPIEGEFDHLSQRIDPQTKTAQDWQPPQPSTDHEWDSTTRRWRLSEEVSAKREARTKALRSIAELEASQGRVVREILLAIAPEHAERLLSIEAQIIELRKSL